MWDFSNTFVTFDNPLYLFDGSGPGGGGTPSSILGGPVIFGGRIIIPAKKLGETVILPFDFISKLQPSETILSATCVVSVYTGTDPSPSSMISGVPMISGTVVNQLVTGGVLGVIYDILARATTSLSQVIELSGYLALVPDLP
jgi:hypothetical protein